jgi:hypothetical protein
MALIRRLRDRRIWGRSERITLGLALGAVATAGTIVAAEVARLARRRSRAEESPDGPLATTGQATVDAVNVALQGYEAAPRHETVLFNMLSGFLGGFALVRLATYGQRGGWWPTGAIEIGGHRIHHFVPGIAIAFGSGAAALLTDNQRLETNLAFPFGAGIGLTLDEAALLLDLRDVYWTREGVLSVQLSLGFAGILGATIYALRMLRRGEKELEKAGRLPGYEGAQVLRDLEDGSG